MSTHPDPEQLSAYIDGELTGADRDDLEQHLTGCSECSATLRGLRATVADMRALPSPVLSEQDHWALRSAISKAQRRPGERYRRFLVGAGGIAAVAAAIVGILALNQATTSSTFSHTGAEVNNGDQIPAIAGPTNSPPSIQTDSTNYNSTSARGLLLSFNGSRTSGLPQNGPGPAAYSAARKSIPAADQAAYTDQISRCETDVFSHGSGGARAIAYIVGHYESTPAFFLIYSVVLSGKTKSEMWVVRQSDCYIRLFLAPQ